MDFFFSQEQEALRAHAKDLLDHVCPPDYAARCDNEARPPREAYQALAKHGWFGVAIPVEYGGTGGSAIDLAILLEETGKHFEELAVWLFRTLTYGGYAVLQHGTPEQKQQLLPKIARGELSFCFGLSEPESEALLKFLVAHMTQPAFTCRLRWAPGTFALWDNRICIHQAFNDYDGFRREMYRTTVAGEPPA